MIGSENMPRCRSSTCVAWKRCIPALNEAFTRYCLRTYWTLLDSDLRILGQLKIVRGANHSYHRLDGKHPPHKTLNAVSQQKPSNINTKWYEYHKATPTEQHQIMHCSGTRHSLCQQYSRVKHMRVVDGMWLVPDTSRIITWVLKPPVAQAYENVVLLPAWRSLQWESPKHTVKTCEIFEGSWDLGEQKQ